MEQHRIAIEPRGGSGGMIWLLFYETLNSPYSRTYKQQLLRIRKSQVVAENDATSERIRRGILSPTIIRDDSQRNVILRGE